VAEEVGVPILLLILGIGGLAIGGLILVFIITQTQIISTQLRQQHTYSLIVERDEHGRITAIHYVPTPR